MASERAFICGNNKYYVVERYGRLIVQRQDWLNRTFVSYARDVAEAVAIIEADARSGRILAA
jgi:hypothetical protein